MFSLRTRLYLIAMKRNLILAIGLLSVLSVSAKVRLDATASRLVDDARMITAPQSRAIERRLPSELDGGGAASFIVVCDTPEEVETLADKGFNVLASVSNMAIVSADAPSLLSLVELDCVTDISGANELNAHLTTARDITGVDDIHEGTGLPQAYDGSGVVVGLMDTGLDLNHANFLDEEGNPRASKLWVITGSTGSVQEYKTTDEIAAFTTDDSGSTHGTHVLGIITGSFNGIGSQQLFSSTGTSIFSSKRKIPYYGVAPKADIAACAGTLEDTNILLAATKVSEYAKSVGKPAVMNVSLGINIGPHDGSEYALRYLAEVGKDIIICMSAGNEGSDKVSLYKEFTASDTQLLTAVSTTAAATGVVDIWGEDDSPLSLTLAAIETSTGTIKYQYKVDTNTDGVFKYLTGNYYTATGYLHDSEFDKYFGDKGAFVFCSEVSENNNRYHIRGTIQTQKGESANGVATAIIIEGAAGTKAYAYTNSFSFITGGIPGAVEGNADQSINNLACGDNVISVGAYVSCIKWPTMSGTYTYSGVKVGALANFSSYGKNFQGTNLPMIVGPGQGLISSYSKYYYDSSGDNSQYTASYTDTKKNRDSYWKIMSGTSMSSPFVAGVVALWLQADPNLTFDDVCKVMKETSSQDEFTAVNPDRWGYGKIEALAGIKYILDKSALGNISIERPGIIITPRVGELEVYAPGTSSVDASIYALDGSVALTASATGDVSAQMTIDTSALAPGVYVVKVITPDGRSSAQKVSIR